MIDNINAKSYDKCVYDKIKNRVDSGCFEAIKAGWKYKVRNSNIPIHGSYITIEINSYVVEETGEILNSTKMVGSLRKWYFGTLSLEDFTEKTFFDALTLFARALGISLQELCTFVLSYIEVGFNYRTNIGIEMIKKSFLNFKSRRYKRSEDEFSITFSSRRNKHASRGGNCKKTSLIIYDKFQEIKEKYITQRIKSHEETEFIERNQSKRHLRIEFKITGGQNYINQTIFKSNYGRITIGFLLKNFDMLYTYFWDEARNIHILAISDHNPLLLQTSKDITDSMIYDFIQNNPKEFYKRTQNIKERGYRKRILKRISRFQTKQLKYNKERFLQNIRCRLYCLIGKDGKISRHKQLIPYPINSTKL